MMSRRCDFLCSFSVLRIIGLREYNYLSSEQQTCGSTSAASTPFVVRKHSSGTGGREAGRQAGEIQVDIIQVDIKFNSFIGQTTIL